MNLKYAALALAAILVAAALFAACARGESTSDCSMPAGHSVIAPAALARPTSGSGSRSDSRTVRRPSVQLSKAPARQASPHVSPHPSKSSRGRNHIDFDLDLDGC